MYVSKQKKICIVYKIIFKKRDKIKSAHQSQKKVKLVAFVVVLLPNIAQVQIAKLLIRTSHIRITFLCLNCRKCQVHICIWLYE